MTRKLTKLAVMVAAATGFSGAAYALDAQSIRVSDGVMFTPTLKVSERHDDNIYATKKDRKSSWVTNLEPSLHSALIGLKRLPLKVHCLARLLSLQ